MKKFSITKLESARKNPIGFAATLSEESQPYGHNPKSVRWLTAAARFHTTGNPANATNYLENSFSKRKQTRKNIAEVEQLQKALLKHFNECNAFGYLYHSHRVSIEIVLSKKVKISGIIWLINTHADGTYSSFTVVDGESDITKWKSELRHPILQNYIAQTIFKCPVEYVTVGIINYRTGTHEHICYSEEDIDIALEELKDIGAKISSVL